MSLINWMKSGNNCEKCPACWESYSCDEWDAGCHVKGDLYDEKVCRLPLFVRKLFVRRAKYFYAHEYDGIYEYHIAQEEKENKCRAAIEKMLAEYVVCYKDSDGELREYTGDVISYSGLSDVIESCTPEFKPSPTIQQQWKELTKQTVMIPINWLKPFVCK